MAVDRNNLNSSSVAELVALVKQQLQRVEAPEAENASLKEQLRASNRATAPSSNGNPNTRGTSHIYHDLQSNRSRHCLLRGNVYGLTVTYLQAGVGSTPRVDAYLLQACGMPSPKKVQASIDRLAARIKARR